MIRRRVLLTIALFALSSSVRATPNYKGDPCIGAWKWARSAGGLAWFVVTPPTDWSHVLYLHKDGTYRFWEEDSVSAYLLSQGAFVIHNPRSDTTSRYVVMENWPLGRAQEITFMGADAFQMYPAGVMDASTVTFTRERSHPEPTGADERRKPARIWTEPWAVAGYQLFLDEQDRARLAGKGLWEVTDPMYPGSVRRNYAYTSSQIPSAVLGDFDGDDSLDYAIQTNTKGYVLNELFVILSNRGQRTTATLLSEPMVFGPPEERESKVGRPTFYLELLPRGQTIQASSGESVTLTHDAILVVRPDGSATPYYKTDSQWRTGRPLSKPPWNPHDPMR